MGVSGIAVGRAMAHAISHRPLTAEGRVRGWASPCGICDGQCDPGTDSKLFGLHLSASVHTVFMLMFIILGMDNKLVGVRSSET
jgi:hypothetical protein